MWVLEVCTRWERPKLGVIPAKAVTSVCDGAAGSKTEVPAFAGMTLWVGTAARTFPPCCDGPAQFVSGQPSNQRVLTFVGMTAGRWARP